MSWWSLEWMNEGLSSREGEQISEYANLLSVRLRLSEWISVWSEMRVTAAYSVLEISNEQANGGKERMALMTHWITWPSALMND